MILAVLFVLLSFQTFLLQVEQIMEKFEKQFEDLDVRTQVSCSKDFNIFLPGNP